MPYYQEEHDVDSFAYVCVLKPNLSSANMRETLVKTLALCGLGPCFKLEWVVPRISFQ
jgi:hypothetical protein